MSGRYPLHTGVNNFVSATDISARHALDNCFDTTDPADLKLWPAIERDNFGGSDDESRL